MSDSEKALPPTEQLTQTETPVFETGLRERWYLALTFGLCILLADAAIFYGPGAGITMLVFLWYALLFAYVGTGGLGRRENRVLLAINLLLALTLALTSNWYFRIWNCGALLLLLPVHAFALSGAATRPWYRPSMLWERFGLLIEGLFGNLSALGPTLGAGKKGPARRALTALLGVLAALIMLAVLIPLLASADALFREMTQSFSEFCAEHLFGIFGRVIFGLLVTPFAFSLLYGLRRPKPLRRPSEEKKPKTVDALLFIILLAVMDALYLLFLAVQSAALFGGPAYLAERGIRYADWARSGFFQLVFVTALNLLITMLARFLSRWEGKGCRAVQTLSTMLIAESGVLLCSAVWRMTLYVAAYGLSFRRAMTYWGMAVMAIFLAAALPAVWRKEISFCRVAFTTAVIGWVLISFTPLDAIVARDNVSRYLEGESSSVSVEYLTRELSYDTLRELGRLDGGTLVRTLDGDWTEPNLTLEKVLSDRQAAARAECAHWETWNLSAALAGEKTE